MVCYVGKDCDSVIHSEYSKFLGVPLEILGMIYYGALTFSYILFSLSPPLYVVDWVFWVLAITAGAFLFSLYLTFIQGFVLREWCEWCLTSATMSTFIFALAAWNAPLGFVEFLRNAHTSLALLHGLAVAVGVGSATITEVLFMRFLKDFRISEEEAGTLKAVSQFIWLALAIIMVSGAGLYLPEAARLLATPKFLAKMVIVGILIVNGAFLNLWIAPRLIRISFGERHEYMVGELRRTRRLAFALGAVSLASWYSVFVLGFLRSFPLSLPIILSIYIGVVASAIFMSQVVDRFLAR